MSTLEIKFHQGINSLRTRLINVYNAAMGASFSVLANPCPHGAGAVDSIFGVWLVKNRTYGCGISPITVYHNLLARGVKRQKLLQANANLCC